ncbi:MAG: hypothetical protein GXP35_10185 [Actinobacteria bacterium]|nr:hypothetical protein [Actinomycetota bacterium]
MGAEEIRGTAAECGSFLRSCLDRDWSASIPDLDMSVIEVVAHAATGCLWYSIDLAAGGKDLEPVELRVKTNGLAVDVLDTFVTHGEVVAAVVETSPGSARGFHPMGTADPSGFAAMACDEMLIHTYDASLGLGVPFAPDVGVVNAVLGRLFPWVEVEPSGSAAMPPSDSWPRLLWANGRIELGDSPRLSGWAWHCAPLSEWDGTIPRRR